MLTAVALLSPLATAQQGQTLRAGELTVTLTPTQPDSNGWYRAGRLELQGTDEGIRGWKLPGCAARCWANSARMVAG
ncbi:hypothetical protein [Deinococcus radiodurans]|uniref:hypothetical protein n=1 Tax=Deinococcus radiodurans TaxID=1299 RepID=UPI0020182942|nr:hypothetical protein [Deinococcus radiodurans]UTA50381.1 hypothetical protein MSS93_11695 [Deinococcus radiodurans]